MKHPDHGFGVIPRKSSQYRHSFLHSKIQAAFLNHNHAHILPRLPQGRHHRALRQMETPRIREPAIPFGAEKNSTETQAPLSRAPPSVPGPRGGHKGATAKVKSSSSTSRTAPNACVWPCIWKFFKYVQKYRELYKVLHTYTAQIQHHQDLYACSKHRIPFSFSFQFLGLKGMLYFEANCKNESCVFCKHLKTWAFYT